MKLVYLDTFPRLAVLPFLSTRDNYDHRFRNNKNHPVSLIGLSSINWTVSRVVLVILLILAQHSVVATYVCDKSIV